MSPEQLQITRENNAKQNKLYMHQLADVYSGILFFFKINLQLYLFLLDKIALVR